MQLKTQFPLTLALSLRERESLSAGEDKPLNREPFPVRAGMLPLPQGEGWGEGEAGALLHHSG